MPVLAYFKMTGCSCGANTNDGVDIMKFIRIPELSGLVSMRWIRLSFF